MGKFNEIIDFLPEINSVFGLLLYSLIAYMFIFVCSNICAIGMDKIYSFVNVEEKI
jgi:hypothetical protein